METEKKFKSFNIFKSLYILNFILECYGMLHINSTPVRFTIG